MLYCIALYIQCKYFERDLLQNVNTMCYNLAMSETDNDSHLRKPISMRISPEGFGLMEALAKKKGVNRTAIFEMAVRLMAEHEGVKAPENTPAK